MAKPRSLHPNLRKRVSTRFSQSNYERCQVISIFVTSSVSFFFFYSEPIFGALSLRFDDHTSTIFIVWHPADDVTQVVTEGRIH